jgi:hypothetical protein
MCEGEKARWLVAREEGFVMRRLLVLLSAVVALVGFVPSVGVAQDATPEASPARTDIRYFLPFGPDGTLNANLTVTSEATGTCDFESIADPDRPDAWDCITSDNEILDPCFENPMSPPDGPVELACAESPFTNEVVHITIDEPLNREKEGAPEHPFAPWALPWALELANGDRCSLLHGTLTVMAGETVYYGCENQGSVLGEVNTGPGVWTVSYAAEGAVSSSLVDVAVAWS